MNNPQPPKKDTAAPGSVQPIVSTPKTDSACFHINTESKHPFDDLAEVCRKLEREAMFYRDLLQQITEDNRKTRARRLAESGLAFWDQMQIEAARRSGANAAAERSGGEQPKPL